MRKLILLFLFALGLSAQPTYTAITVDQVTDSQARVIWTTSANSTNTTEYIKWGTTATLPLPFETARLLAAAANSNWRHAVITGVKPGTTIYIQPISLDSAGVAHAGVTCTSGAIAGVTLTGLTCGADGEPPHFSILTEAAYATARGTTAASDIIAPAAFATPTPPTPDPTASYTLDATCSNWTSIWNSAITAACTDGKVAEVIMPSDAVCTGKQVPKKICDPYIYFHTSDLTAIPPAGFRVNGTETMPTLKAKPTYTGAATSYALSFFTSTTPVATCGADYCTKNIYVRGIRMTHDSWVPTGYQSWYPITALAATTNAYNITSGYAAVTEQYATYRVCGVTGLSPEVSGADVCKTYQDYSNGTTYSQAYMGTATNAAGWNTDGYVMGTGAQLIKSIVCDPGVDCVVSVDAGQKTGIGTGNLVIVRDAEGLSGLAGGSALSESYWTDYVSDTSFKLRGTADVVTGTHTADTGYYVADPDTHQLVSIPNDAYGVVMDQVDVTSPGFPARASTAIYDFGDLTAIVNSHLKVSAWLHIAPPGGSVSSGSAAHNNGLYGLRTTDNLAPQTINARFGQGKLYRNLTIGPTHGLPIFIDEGGSLGDPETSYYKHPQDMWITRNSIIVDADSFCQNCSSGTGPKRYHPNRQSIEFKRGRRVKIDGNLLDGGYSSEAAVPPQIILSARVGLGAGAPHGSTNELRDFTITNNEQVRGTAALGIQAVDTVPGSSFPDLTHHILYQNNLVRAMDHTNRRGSPSGQNGAVANYFPSPVGGSHIQVLNPAKHLYIRNNTFGEVKGSGSLNFYFFAGGQTTNWRVEDNLFTFHKPNTSWASVFNELSAGTNSVPAVATPAWPSTSVATGLASKFKRANESGVMEADPNTLWRNNVFIRGVTNTSGDYTSSAIDINAAQCDTYLANGGVFSTPIGGCFGSTATFAARVASDAKFMSYLTGDMRLGKGSPFRSAGPYRSLEGTALGADYEAVWIARGRVRNARVIGVTAGVATVGYTAPDSAACVVRAGTTDTADSGGVRHRATNVTIGGATSLTLYCGTERYTCPVTRGACSVVAP